MEIHIDWLSFTLPTIDKPHTLEQLYTLGKRTIEREQVYTLGKTIYNGIGYEAGPGRAPYKRTLLREDNGCLIAGNSHTDTVLFELSGRGCEPLRDFETAAGYLEPICDRVTRIDVAGDIRCDTRPADFMRNRDSHRFRHLSYISSDTGETCYIGSPKSDRFCRVYRYNSPHPRSEYLRCEFVFRRAMAKIAAEDLTSSNSLASFLARCGVTWGFNHRDWRPGVETNEGIRAPIVKREDEQTIRWLYAQVIPAMRRSIKTGALDMQHFLQCVYSDE